MEERGKAFSELVYRLLMIEKIASLEDVAEALGMSYHSLHARLHNKTLFSADEINGLIKTLGNADIVDFLLDGSGLMAFERQNTVSPANGDSIFKRTSHLAIETANVLEAVEIAMSDDRIDHRDAIQIQKEIVDVERALATIRHALER